MAEDLSTYEYLGRHDKVGTAVGAGDFAAGALNESTFKKLVEKGEPIRELVRFPNVTKPWIARSGLDPVVFDALKQSLLEIKNKKALKGLKSDGFLEGFDSDYAQIRAAMENNFQFFEERKESTVAEAASKPVEVAKPVATAKPQVTAVETTTTASTSAPAIMASQASASNGPQHITINVVIPEASTGVQDALKSADAGEL